MKKLFVRCIIITAAIAVYAMLFRYLELWKFNFKDMKSASDIFCFALIVLLYALIISGVGVISGSRIADKIFIVLNGIYLLCGLYAVYFAWTFYIFETPTLMDRIQHIRMSLAIGVVWPLLLFYYFQKKGKGK